MLVPLLMRVLTGHLRTAGGGPHPGVIVTLVSPAVNAWHERLAGAGVEVVTAPSFSEQYRIHHAFYRDPDGQLVEIQEFDDPAWAEPGSQYRRGGLPAL